MSLLLLASTAQAADSWNELALRRAVTWWAAGEPDRALDVLADRDPSAPDPDRARGDFLAAWAHHVRGERAAFHETATELVDAPDAPEWVRVLEPLVRIERDAAGVDAADLPAPPAALPAALPAPDDIAPDRDAIRRAGLEAAAHERWDDAYERLAEAERDWTKDDARLADLRAATDEGKSETLWNVWSASGRPGDGRALDRSRLERQAHETLEQVLDLRATPRAHDARITSGDLVVSSPADELPAAVRRPDAAERRAVAGADDALAVADAELAREQRRLAEAHAEAGRIADYQERGLDHARDERAVADSLSMQADALLASSDRMAAALAGVRDEELRRIAERTGELRERARRARLVARALRFFRAEAPGSRTAVPDSVPTPSDLLQAEELLDTTLTQWIDTFATRGPALVTRSHDVVWSPRVTEGPRAIAAAVRTDSTRITALAAALAAARSAALDPSRLLPQERRVATARARVDTLATARRDLRLEVARRALADATTRHRAEGEGIEYALAVTVHERGVAAGDADSGAALRAEAGDRYERFLRDFPSSPARSEIRFRLADVRMRRAQDDFRTRVATFLERQPAADDWSRPELAPFVDYEGAMSLYRDILRDDPTWVHRDAVLHETGMILAEQGDPEGPRLLQELVTAFPDSPHATSAHLRLGDALFEQGQWRPCLPYYEEAARTADPERAAIARYRIAWATFALDRFDESAQAAVALLDHYAEHPEAAERTDLTDEAMDHLVHALARGGGAPAFSRLFAATGPRPYEKRTLTNLSSLLRDVSLFDDAATCDSLRLLRWPLDPDALVAATELIDARERGGNPDGALAARLELAPVFRHGSVWSAAQPDSVRVAGDDFARGAYRTVALQRHTKARETSRPEDWRAALDLYDTLLDAWPEHAEAASFHYQAGEAAAALDRCDVAVAHFDSAARATNAPFAVDAAWQAVATRDAWYESTGDSTLARGVIASIGDFVRLHPTDERSADLVWRSGSLAYRHGWREESADALRDFATLHPGHPAALDAARLRGQALYELERYREAGEAWEVALDRARVAGADSVAAEIAPLLPHCAFRDAEQRLAAGGRHAVDNAAARFDAVAARWPEWEHADQALYRAGLTWKSAHHPDEAIRSWSALADRHPDSEYARDALLEVAQVCEHEKRGPNAATAYHRFATAFPKDPDAPAALLTAADLLESSGAGVDAASARDEYLERYPDDVANAFAILEPRAKRELEATGPDHALSALLAAPAGTSPLRRYLDLAAQHDSLASPQLLAEVRFRRGEEARAAYERSHLSQPLEPSITRKKALLDDVLQEYGAASAYAVVPWNRAAAFRIGECLVEFGDALRDSERPVDLKGDDLLAYEEVLENRSWDFWDRGEETWAGLVRRADDRKDEWCERATTRLWPRLARRFIHRPELEHPRIHATAPTGETTR